MPDFSSTCKVEGKLGKQRFESSDLTYDKIISDINIQVTFRIGDVCGWFLQGGSITIT